MVYKTPGDTLYYWVYASGVISFVVAWGPVIILYPFSFMEDVDAKYAYLIGVMASIDGPFLGNMFPMIFAWICYFTGYNIKTGWAIG